MKLVFIGEPLSNQHIYGSNGRGGRFLKAEALGLKQYYEMETRIKWDEPVKKCDFAVRVDLFFKDKKRRDAENHCKLALDALEGIVYENDCQIMDLHIVKHHGSDNPRIEITPTALV